MRARIGLALVLLAMVGLAPARADGPRMLLASAWSRIPSQAELDGCPLAPDLPIPPRVGLTIMVTCTVDDAGRLRDCHPDERGDPRLQSYALCVSEFFEARPGVHGDVIVPIWVAPPQSNPPRRRGRR